MLVVLIKKPTLGSATKSWLARLMCGIPNLEFKAIVLKHPNFCQVKIVHSVECLKITETSSHRLHYFRAHIQAIAQLINCNEFALIKFKSFLQFIAACKKGLPSMLSALRNSANTLCACWFEFYNLIFMKTTCAVLHRRNNAKNRFYHNGQRHDV